MRREIETQNSYRFFSDPGHAWLQVPSAEIKRLGIKPSGYSYINGDYHYLEEDCDAPLFDEAKQARGEAYSIEEVYQEHTPIRSYRRCC